MKLPIWHVDAFAARRFAGNPAAVIPLGQWLPDATLQAIAAENNLSETAFLVRQGMQYAIRWFTPEVEVPLCGHATLAAGWVVLQALEPHWSSVTFQSQSGALEVLRDGERLALDFPAIAVEGPVTHTGLVKALGREPTALYKGFQWLAVYDGEAAVRELKPDFSALKALDLHGVIVTAAAGSCDFVSRFFAPGAGIPEDPVTGSAHSRLVPYWAKRLNKTELHARQLSARGGELWCQHRGERVLLAGYVTPYLTGEIQL